MSLLNRDYVKAFGLLYLYDDGKDKNLLEGTVLSESEAKNFFFRKRQHLESIGYKVKDFEIENIGQGDGEPISVDVTIIVEQNGKTTKHFETLDIYNGKIWVIYSEDQFDDYRDGKMNIPL
ncbi:hypothetical protein AB6A23_05290 [Paenibacillus tarimensis]